VGNSTAQHSTVPHRTAPHRSAHTRPTRSSPAGDHHHRQLAVAAANDQPNSPTIRVSFLHYYHSYYPPFLSLVSFFNRGNSESPHFYSCCSIYGITAVPACPRRVTSTSLHNRHTQYTYTTPPLLDHGVATHRIHSHNRQRRLHITCCARSTRRLWSLPYPTSFPRINYPQVLAVCDNVARILQPVRPRQASPRKDVILVPYRQLTHNRSARLLTSIAT
jgi:hypothetical protein